MKNTITTALLLLFCIASLSAQDKHFTQFYGAPLTLNPALTGVMEGRYRIGVQYRDQWRGILDEPINTFALMSDFRFRLPVKKVRQDALGLGIMFFNDKVNVVDFNTTQIAVSLAYHKALSDDERQFLSLGIQGGLTQRNVNYESLNFHDEFDGFSGYNMGTGEILPENNFSYADYNVGLNYSARFGRYGGLYAGAALHHILRPSMAFFETGSAEGRRLHAKYSGQVAANIPLRRDGRASLLPRVLVANQGPHMEINAGANVRAAFGQFGSSAFHIGGWLRPVRNADGMGMDAAVALVGFEFNNVLLGLSYDLNLRALNAGQRQGAFEISIAYLGNYENEGILCPKF